MDTATTADLKMLARLYGRSLLLTDDYTAAELGAFLFVTERLAALDRAGKKTPLLADELAYALFFDNSTRTKSAWAGAAARLGMQPVIVDGSSTQVSHGETAVETGAMLGMNAHALGVRHDLILGEGNAFMRDVKRGIDDYLEATKDPRKVPVVNLQCDIDHPTQTLADLCWLRERFPEGLAGKKIAVSWAYSPSYAKPLSVPQGLVMLLTRFGANVTLAHPEGYPLMQKCLDSAKAHAAESGGSFRVVESMDEAFARCRRGLSQELGTVRPDAVARAGEPRARFEADGRDREGSARAERPPQGLDLRRAAHGVDARRRRSLHALPPRRHRRRGLPRRHGPPHRERGARGELEGLRHHGGAGHREGQRPFRAPRRPVP